MAATMKQTKSQMLMTIKRLEAELAEANGTDDSWFDDALRYLSKHRANCWTGDCPMPELYRAVASHLTIGQFHDGLRELQRQGRIRFGAFAGAMYTLEDGQYAMVLGQEIKFYVGLPRR